jgi:TM2 domain-containing membrane protein YozV
MERNDKGATGWLLLWLVGIPVPILLLLFIMRGCK